MKIGFYGDGPWAHKSLECLINQEDYQIDYVCLRYDTQDPELKLIADDAKIPVFTHPKVNSVEFLEKIQLYHSDLLVSMSFNQILKKEILSIAPRGFINCHAGLLPSYRGRNILNWVLINDEKEFGITVHQVDEGIDTGDIWLQESYPINEHDDYSSLLKIAYEECPKLLLKTIDKIYTNETKPTPQKQINRPGFYCTQRKIGDELLDWNKLSSREVFNFVRALAEPGPLARSFINEKEISIKKIAMVENAHSFIGIPGAVLEVGQDGVLVKTRDSFVRILNYNYCRKLRVGDRLCLA